jgi:threonine dehydratase
MVINHSDLDPARIAAAATVIDPVFLHSPQYVDGPLSRHLGRRILVKDETRNPLRSFKGRGADFLASGISPGRHLVCASSGNFGQAMAYAARSHGHRCSVFLEAGSSPIAQERIRGLGAEVRLIEGDDAAVKHASRRYAAAANGRVLVRDGQEAAIAEGAGTIGLELVGAGALDAVIVPVGDGALISGVGCAIKRHAPATRVIGVLPGVGSEHGRELATRGCDTGAREDHRQRARHGGPHPAFCSSHASVRGRDRARQRVGAHRRDAPRG